MPVIATLWELRQEDTASKLKAIETTVSKKKTKPKKPTILKKRKKKPK